jgi:para-aminobenzoate synthetase component I
LPHLTRKRRPSEISSRVKISNVREIEITSDRLVAALLRLSAERRLVLLDSCGVGGLGSDILIAGIDPVATVEISGPNAEETLRIFEEKLSSTDLAAVFTISYHFGLKLQNIASKHHGSDEPDIYLALFDCLVVHDYATGRTSVRGNAVKVDSVGDAILDRSEREDSRTSSPQPVRSNFTKPEYMRAVEQIQELIRAGDTYQANLTQQLTVGFDGDVSAAGVFSRLRRDHPAPFAAYLDRGGSKVVSASPEMFVRVNSDAENGRTITASPIKGTRKRGASAVEDDKLRAELQSSAKDRAENTMIVDLMRNDLGRICEYGSVVVDSLCRLEEHPTLFHLVSNVHGTLSTDVTFSEIIRAVFPCGSITGAPKLRTMEIIDEIEPDPRGLSMGAIGFQIPGDVFGMPATIEMSVAIRTMVIRNGEAIFNVGGGIVIDSDPESEFDESMLKAKALLTALGVPGQK